MSNIAQVLRDYAYDILDQDGDTMQAWDQIRQQVETRKGSDLPRLNFESLVENFADAMKDGAIEIERLRGLFSELRQAWFKGPDLDKDAICKEALRLIIESEKQPGADG